ncbi:MAG: hypothetical protein GY788_25945, partial [bacterium]|nr:hypothetical protein [bacterium]
VIIAYGWIGLHFLDVGPDTDLTIANTQFISNSYRAIQMDWNNASGRIVLQNNSALGNDINGVGVQGSITDTLHLDWSEESNLPLVMLNDLTIPISSNLSLSPGVIIKGWHPQTGNYNINVYGTLSATGTISQPIVFTSRADDTYGGDTNNDGNASLPTRDDWGSIRFYSGSRLAAIDHVIIAYGWIGLHFLDVGPDTDLTIANTQFISNSYRAIQMDWNNASGRI